MSAVVFNAYSRSPFLSMSIVGRYVSAGYRVDRSRESILSTTLTNVYAALYDNFCSPLSGLRKQPPGLAPSIVRTSSLTEPYSNNMSRSGLR